MKRWNPKKIIKDLFILAAIVGLAYFGNLQVQSWLGQRAVESTGLPHNSYTDALAQATAENKLVLAEFSAIWCPSCRKFDKQVLSNTQVLASIESDYVFVRLEWESAKDKILFERYGVRGFPTLAVLNASGDLLQFMNTTFEPQDFQQQLARVAVRNSVQP